VSQVLVFILIKCGREGGDLRGFGVIVLDLNGKPGFCISCLLVVIPFFDIVFARSVALARSDFLLSGSQFSRPIFLNSRAGLTWLFFAGAGSLLG
jgi:hypothetical protein